MVLVADSGSMRRVLLPTEGLPEILALGDLNGDGIQDLLLMTADESTVLASIVLVYPDSLHVPTVAADFDWTAFQYSFADNVLIERCFPSVEPRLDTLGGALVLSVASGTSATSDCQNPPRRRFVISGNRLVSAP
jgi:hypothetical protein